MVLRLERLCVYPWTSVQAVHQGEQSQAKMTIQEPWGVPPTNSLYGFLSVYGHVLWRSTKLFLYVGYDCRLGVHKPPAVVYGVVVVPHVTQHTSCAVHSSLIMLLPDLTCRLIRGTRWHLDRFSTSFNTSLRLLSLTPIIPKTHFFLLQVCPKRPHKK